MVIFVGVARKDLKDPHHPPADAEGPFVISGQNRFVTCFAHFLQRYYICKEIVDHKLHPNPALFRSFQMQIYCFPKAKDPKQLLLIKSLGSSENELAKIYVEMEDWEKLTVVREGLVNARKAKMKGLLFMELNCC